MCDLTCLDLKKIRPTQFMHTNNNSFKTICLCRKNIVQLLVSNSNIEPFDKLKVFLNGFTL
jgi:hypothetical protein